MDENSTTDEKNVPNDQERTHDQTEKMQMALEGLRPGSHVIVTRLRPSWCKGWLEQVDYVDGEPIDMEYFARTWGGEVLRLQVRDERGKYVTQADVPMYSYPPRFRGQLLEGPKDEPIPYKSQSTAHEHAAPPPAPAYYQSPPPPAPNPLDSANSLAKLVQSLSESQQSQLTNYLDFMQRTTQPQNQGFAGIEQIAALGKVYEQLRGVFGGQGGAAPPPVGGDEDNFLGYLTDIVKTVMAPKQQTPAVHPAGYPPPPPRQYPPVSGPQGQPLRRDPPPHEQPPLSPAVPMAKEKLGEIAKMLSQLSDQDAVDVVTGALGMMPEDKQGRVIPAFMGQADALFGDEDEEETEGEDEPEGEKETEPDHGIGPDPQDG